MWSQIVPQSQIEASHKLCRHKTPHGMCIITQAVLNTAYQNVVFGRYCVEHIALGICIYYVIAASTCTHSIAGCPFVENIDGVCLTFHTLGDNGTTFRYVLLQRK